uniref:Uracil phosphoribosyltransferase n=1 Tax=Polysiphonia sp. TaxID=1967842 RepID=A0A1Z1M3N0_9FLOR|nr:uracil phosphoribosyltransferase [Polysiphonia sp.]
MKLSIYQISHPIIKIVLTKIDYKNQEFNYKYIGFLFIYEIFRKCININRIYIKQIKKIKYFDTMNNSEKYFILTNLSYTYDLISDITTILPDINIIQINYNSISNIEHSIKNLKIESTKDKVFILEKITKNENILNLVKYLKHKKKIDTQNINISCIMIYEETLNKIGNQYPELKVYTTKILDNNN